jgi:hypothetical protein
MHEFILHNKYPALHQGMYESNKILVRRKLFNKLCRSRGDRKLMNIKSEIAIKIKFVSHEGTFLIMKKKPFKILLGFSCSVFEIFLTETE